MDADSGCSGRFGRGILRRSSADLRIGSSADVTSKIWTSVFLEFKNEGG
jgi:hypothetical protein